MTKPCSLDTVARLHDLTTLFHVFIYFGPEAAEEYEKVGLTGRSGYFASRTAAMGPAPTEVVIATFYNFAPTIVTRAMEGVWGRVSAEDAQGARFAAAQRVLDEHVRPVLSADDIAEASGLAQRAIDGLSWAGRPLAAGNAAVLDRCDDDLLRLWQQATVLREWRGDCHIALLLTEPLSGIECTVVGHAQRNGRGFTKASRAWPDAEWDAAVERLIKDGWIESEEALSEDGARRREALERRTNELASAMWDGFTDDEVNRLGDLLQPAVDALTRGNYFAALGKPAPDQ